MEFVRRQLRVFIRMSGIQTAPLTTRRYLPRSANLYFVFPLGLPSQPQAPLCHSHLRTCGFLFGHNILWLWHEQAEPTRTHANALKARLLFFPPPEVCARPPKTLRDFEEDSRPGDVDLLVFLPLVTLVRFVLKKYFCAYLLMLDSPQRLRGGHGNLKLQR